MSGVFQCRVIVQPRCPVCATSVENIPLQAERHSGRRKKLFFFPPERVFTFRPESCSESQRNGVRLHTGIAFAFDRITQADFNKSLPAYQGPVKSFRGSIVMTSNHTAK
jgi:hypothetical protein